ncbi:MAG: acyltransferase [Acidobacteria bacterium]|nr:acyltransferase [Acidobacteriota bacterium]
MTDPPPQTENHWFGLPAEGIFVETNFHRNSVPIAHNTHIPFAGEPILRPWMPELDTLRGVAVLSVLIFHGAGLRIGLQEIRGIPSPLTTLLFSGWTGVDLFFVLSGFLITGILLDSREKPAYFRRFYLRRALRIIPVYYALLIALLGLTWLGLIRHPVSFSFIGLSFAYLSNMAGLFGVPMQYAVLWSLSVEEHFYLLWPALVRWTSRQGLFFVATALCLMCPVLRAGSFLLGYANGETAFGNGHTWLVADGLATGAILAIFHRSRLATRRGTWVLTAATLGLSVGAFVIGAPFGLLQQSHLLGAALRQTVLNAFFLGILSSFLLVGTSRWKNLVQWSALRFFGEISYGLYLIHILIYDLTEKLIIRCLPQLRPQSIPAIVVIFCLGTAWATAVAYLSRRYFEEYFLRLKDQLLVSGRSAKESVEAYPQAEKDLEHLRTA